MTGTAIQQFLVEMEPHRDRLFTLALALASTPAAAEALLHRAVHEALLHYPAKNGTPFLEWFESYMQAQAPEKSPAAGLPVEPMPIALWARIHAAVQIESAKRGGVAGHSLLNYDPLLAPKKPTPVEDDTDLLNLSPATSFIIAEALVLVAAIVVTIVLTTRHGDHPAPSSQPATAPATRPA